MLMSLRDEVAKIETMGEVFCRCGGTCLLMKFGG
jgi:hypothetical protein